MARTASVALLGLLVAAWAPPAAAQLYKWEDEHGNIHFSDTPPRSGSALDLRDDRAPGGAEGAEASGDAIAYRGGAPSRLAFLKQVMVHFDGVPPGRQKEIGEMRSGTSCTNPRAIRIKSGYKLNREASLRWHFHDLLRGLGYRSPEEVKTAFDAEQEQGADLSIIAVITDLEVAECVATGGSSSSPYRSGQRRERVKNRSEMTVEWQVRDNLKRRVVYETRTEGSFRDGRFVERTDDTPGSLERAFLEASRALLADAEFAALLDPGAPPARAVGFDPEETAEAHDVSVVDGRCNGRGPGFRARFERLKQGTATIRTATGHGSGFLVSEDGYVLTNQHVVAGAGSLLVILDGDEYQGRVVGSDPVRDVALVRLDALPASDPLSVCRARAGVGETVYVVGTPLDERLSLTVTKGIISQHRTLKEQPYYQTDAVINKGNSGGPAFNEQGEVIGIAVAATFAKGGGGMGINYLIPIQEALAAVLGPAPPASRR